MGACMHVLAGVGEQACGLISFAWSSQWLSVDCLKQWLGLDQGKCGEDMRTPETYLKAYFLFGQRVPGPCQGLSCMAVLRVTGSLARDCGQAKEFGSGRLCWRYIQFSASPLSPVPSKNPTLCQVLPQQRESSKVLRTPCHWLGGWCGSLT